MILSTCCYVKENAGISFDELHVGVEPHQGGTFAFGACPGPEVCFASSDSGERDCEVRFTPMNRHAAAVHSQSMLHQRRRYARRFQRDDNSLNFSDDPVVRDMLLRLDQLERQTDHRHPDSENDKDASANKALRIVSELGAYVAGWAMDHKIGLAIDGLGNIPDLARLGTPASSSIGSFLRCEHSFTGQTLRRSGSRQRQYVF
jgi:hypothetical protein